MIGVLEAPRVWWSKNGQPDNGSRAKDASSGGDAWKTALTHAPMTHVCQNILPERISVAEPVSR